MKPILSILVPVYNHEKFLLKALQSIEKQNILYSFEVVIGEDASTDSSRNVLKKFQETAPSNYFFVYREENRGMLGNISDLFYRARGKYVILLEGDDYWIYNNKINEQIAFLEENKHFSGYAHSVVMIDEADNVLDMIYISQKGDGIYKIDDYLCGKLPGQTASFMYRNYFSTSGIFRYWGKSENYAVDRFIAFVVATKGYIYCTSQQWSAYRYVTQGGSSYSANLDYTSEEFAVSALEFHRTLYNYTLGEKCNKRCVRVSEKLFYKSYFRDEIIRKKESKLKTLMYVLRSARFPLTTMMWIGWQLLCRSVKKENT